jgi:hypothetical protein
MLRFVRIKIEAESLDSISVKVEPDGTSAPKKALSELRAVTVQNRKDGS